jgi:hypothetical protein
VWDVWDGSMSVPPADEGQAKVKGEEGWYPHCEPRRGVDSHPLVEGVALYGHDKHI